MHKPSTSAHKLSYVLHVLVDAYSKQAAFLSIVSPVTILCQSVVAPLTTVRATQNYNKSNTANYYLSSVYCFMFYVDIHGAVLSTLCRALTLHPFSFVKVVIIKIILH